MNVCQLLADLVVVVHLAYVFFVIVGLGLILAGIVLRWRWVRGFWFRIVHFLTIAVVVFQALMGIICPLTSLEDWLRVQAGQEPQAGSFIGRLAHDLLFYDASQWVFTVCYCLFGLAVLVTLIFAPPRWPWRKETGTTA